MTFSSNPPIERGLDAMFIVYSLLNNHPAATVCEQFIRARSGWFTTALTLLEARAILSKIYSIDPALAIQKLSRFAAGPIEISAVDAATVSGAMQLAQAANIDLTDAVLLWSAEARGLTKLATDDRKLARACQQYGIAVENPIDATLRQQMTAWEVVNLPPKGLPRMLRLIYQWLDQQHPQVAQDFWSQTGGGMHLP